MYVTGLGGLALRESLAQCSLAQPVDMMAWVDLLFCLIGFFWLAGAWDDSRLDIEAQQEALLAALPDGKHKQTLQRKWPEVAMRSADASFSGAPAEVAPSIHCKGLSPPIKSGQQDEQTMSQVMQELKVVIVKPLRPSAKTFSLKGDVPTCGNSMELQLESLLLLSVCHHKL